MWSPSCTMWIVPLLTASSSCDRNLAMMEWRSLPLGSQLVELLWERTEDEALRGAMLRWERRGRDNTWHTRRRGRLFTSGRSRGMGRGAARAGCGGACQCVLHAQLACLHGGSEDNRILDREVICRSTALHVSSSASVEMNRASVWSSGCGLHRCRRSSGGGGGRCGAARS